MARLETWKTLIKSNNRLASEVRGKSQMMAFDDNVPSINPGDNLTAVALAIAS